MSKIKTYLPSILAVLALVLASIIYFTKDQVAFIDYNEVYNNCEMKKDLEKELERVTNLRKSSLDSLQLQLNFISNQVKSNTGGQAKLTEFEDMKSMYMNLEQQYKEENMRLKESYFGQIRSEISEKIKQYADANGYDFVFSLMGDGALQYGAEGKNITKDFQAFLNK